MSLTTNRSNIYIASPSAKYDDVMTPWNAFMEKDFTIYLKSKVLVDKLDTGSHTFMFSRNGRHAGISTYKDEESNIHVSFTYWFWKSNLGQAPDGSTVHNNPTTPVQKTVTYTLLPQQKDQFNEYTVTCSHLRQKMFFYVNNKLVGEIDHQGLDKSSYKESYMWLGCGNMVTDNEDHKNIGEYEHELFFCLDKLISLDEVRDLKENYKTLYVDDYFGLPVLSSKTPHKDNIHFFLDFNQKTEYKIWNLCFNGCYFNFYIENNTMF